MIMRYKTSVMFVKQKQFPIFALCKNQYGRLTPIPRVNLNEKG